jgi:hypothetical protein
MIKHMFIATHNNYVILHTHVYVVGCVRTTGNRLLTCVLYVRYITHSAYPLLLLVCLIMCIRLSAYV